MQTNRGKRTVLRCRWWWCCCCVCYCCCCGERSWKESSRKTFTCRYRVGWDPLLLCVQTSSHLRILILTSLYRTEIRPYSADLTQTCSYLEISQNRSSWCCIMSKEIRPKVARWNFLTYLRCRYWISETPNPPTLAFATFIQSSTRCRRSKSSNMCYCQSIFSYQHFIHGVKITCFRPTLPQSADLAMKVPITSSTVDVPLGLLNIGEIDIGFTISTTLLRYFSWRRKWAWWSYDIAPHVSMDAIEHTCTDVPENRDDEILPAAIFRS